MESIHAGLFKMKSALGLTTPSFVSNVCRRLAFAAPKTKTISDRHDSRPAEAATPSITPLSRNAGSVWNQIWRGAAYS
jgi:hypothetical protein